MKFVAAVFAVCLLLVSIGIGCADRLLLYPSREPADAGRATPVMVNVDGRQVEVFTARSPAAAGREPEGFVLEFCGNATRAEHIAQFVRSEERRVGEECRSG